MEHWDVLDKNGRPTGRTVVSTATLAPGEYHLVVHLWIKDRYGKFLIQKRSPDLIAQPGVWAPTTGSVQAGETGPAAAVRELEEELGVIFDESLVTVIGRVLLGNRIADIFLAEFRGQFPSVQMGSEVSEIAWVSSDRISEMVESGDFFPYPYLDQILNRT